MIETVESAGIRLALIVRREFSTDGITFFTDDSDTQQLGYMNRAKGYVIPPHVHIPVERTVGYTKEVLLVRSGSVRVDFYDDDRVYLLSVELFEGDVVLLSSGGHGFEMLEDCEMIEVKQGPYARDADKERFDPISTTQLVVRRPG